MKNLLCFIALCLGVLSHIPSQASCQNTLTFSTIPNDRQIEALESFFGFSLATPPNFVSIGLRGGFEIVRVQNGRASSDRTPLGLISIDGDRLGVELRHLGLWSFSKFRQKLGQQMAWTILADKNRLVITGKAVEDDRINLALSFEKNQKGRFDVNFKLDLLGVDSDFSETIKGLDLEITSDTFDTIREMQHSGIR